MHNNRLSLFQASYEPLFYWLAWLIVGLLPNAMEMRLHVPIDN